MKTKKVLYIVSNIFSHHIAHTFLHQSFDFHHFTTHIYPSHYTPLSPLPYAALHCTSLHFMFSYDSLLCTEWPTGIESRMLPLWKRTALRLNLDESIKSRQSSGMWLILSVCIRPSISVQATRPLSILKIWTRSSCVLRYTEIMTFSFRRFHCCNLEPNSSALL